MPDLRTAEESGHDVGWLFAVSLAPSLPRSDAGKRSGSRPLREVLVGAVDLPAAEREAYLDEACGDDSELRREAESILAHDADATQFMKTSKSFRTPTLNNGKRCVCP